MRLLRLLCLCRCRLVCYIDSFDSCRSIGHFVSSVERFMLRFAMLLNGEVCSVFGNVRDDSS